MILIFARGKALAGNCSSHNNSRVFSRRIYEFQKHRSKELSQRLYMHPNRLLLGSKTLNLLCDILNSLCKRLNMGEFLKWAESYSSSMQYGYPNIMPTPTPTPTRRNFQEQSKSRMERLLL